MQVVTKYVLDGCSIDEHWKVLSVRSRVQRWAQSGTEEMCIDDGSNLHRITVTPGDWAAADQWGVRHYADLVWTQEVIDAWANRPKPARGPFPAAQ